MPIDDMAPAEQFDDLAQQERAGLLGIWIFLATELLLFGGLISTFAILRMQHADVFAAAAGHLNLALGSVNTAVLLTSGLTMTLTEQAVNIKRRRLTLGFLCITILLGVLFLAIKAYEWHSEFREHLMPVLHLPFEFPGQHPRVAELFFNCYFTMTGLHGIHMLVGIVLLGIMAVRVSRWHQPEHLRRQLRTLGLYWALVDVVWIFVFTSLYLLRA